MQTSLTLKKEETSREDKNIKLEPPIFIVGCARSGTTLLLKVLSNHRNIYGVREETHLFVDYRVDYYEHFDEFEAIGDLENLTMSVLTLMFSGVQSADVLAQKREYTSRVVMIFNEIKEVNGYKSLKNKFDVFNFCVSYLTLKESKKRWAEKTPANRTTIDSILERYPTAQFIEIYRDPRAVYSSWKNTKTKRSQSSNLFEHLYIWNQTAFLSERFHKVIPRQFYRLCYENLITSPEDELRELCIFLNEGFDPEMLNVEVVNSYFKDFKEQKGFSTIPLERWKAVLKDEEKIFVDIATRKYRKKLGYEDSDVKLSPFLLLSLVLFSLKTFLKSLNNQTFFNYCLNRLISAIKQRSYYFRKLAWFIKRKQVIDSYLKSHAVKKLQLGANGNVLHEWLNSDIAPKSRDVIFIDSSRPFPFEDNIFDYIFSEHQIEHLKYSQGLVMLKECFRSLKPGGKIRITTPDLESFINLYKNPKEIEKAYIDYTIKRCFPELEQNKEIFVLNNLFINFGHRFIYDKNSLESNLKSIGFVDIKFYTVGVTDEVIFKNIEQHPKMFERFGFKNGEELSKFDSIACEAKKPKT